MDSSESRVTETPHQTSPCAWQGRAGWEGGDETVPASLRPTPGCQPPQGGRDGDVGMVLSPVLRGEIEEAGPGGFCG